jgi:hypothetical protein
VLTPDIYSWPDNVLIASGLNPQHDQFQGRASSGTHQIFTNQRYAIDLNGFTGTTVQYGPGAFAPVRFASGTVGNVRPLLVSPQHRMFVTDWRVKLLFGEDEVLVAAKDLVDGVGVTRVDLPEITYVHLLLARHDILDAEGAATESLHLGPYIVNRLPGTARAEIAALFPSIAPEVRHRPGPARRCLRAWEARFLSERARAA